MKRALLAAVVALAPTSGWAQLPPSPPIQSEPLPPPNMPPAMQVPPTQRSPGQPQPLQPSGGGLPRQMPPLPSGQAPVVPGQGRLSPPSAPMPATSQPPQAPGTPQPLPPSSPSPTAPSLPGQPPQQSGQPAAPGRASGQPAGLTPAPPAPAVDAWVPQGGAILQVLDKVNATTATLKVRVGQSATYGSLRIQVLACQIRPPHMPQDAAASLVIKDTNPDQPGFRGWMLQNEPFLSMLQSPSYDVRVEGCTP